MEKKNEDATDMGRYDNTLKAADDGSDPLQEDAILLMPFYDKNPMFRILWTNFYKARMSYFD